MSGSVKRLKKIKWVLALDVVKKFTSDNRNSYKNLPLDFRTGVSIAMNSLRAVKEITGKNNRNYLKIHRKKRILR